MVTLLGLVRARERLFHQLPESSIFQWYGMVEVVEAVKSIFFFLRVLKLYNQDALLLYTSELMSVFFLSVIYSILDFGKRLE